MRWCSFLFFAALGVLVTAAVPAAFAFEPSGLLEIHYINIGQGGSTLIIGPDGTRILYDFGNAGRGKAIADYLENQIGLDPEDGIDFTIVSHRDQDHYGGFVDVIEAGYDVKTANFDSGSDKPASAKMRSFWLDPAATTAAGAVRSIPLGLRIPIGQGAEAKIVAANGAIFGQDADDIPFARNENDRSIVLYVKFGNFDYIIDGDLGDGRESCTARQTSQKQFQRRVAQALIDLGWMDERRGVDVLHIAHHGSESSTSAVYYNLMKPEVGLISVGLNQGTFRHPREDVLDNVLLGPNRPSCVTAPALEALFQTESGLAGSSSTGRTSFRGLPVGDIKLTTDGVETYRISGTRRVGEDTAACALPEAGFWEFTLDEIEGRVPLPQINGNCTVSATSCACDD